MPNRRRNQTGIFTHEAQDFTHPLRSRGEVIYGNDYDDGSNFEGDPYHRPRRPVASPYSDKDDEWRNREYYGARNRSNYGTGGYYGPTYHQAQEWNEQQRSGRRGEGYRSSDERYHAGRDRYDNQDTFGRESYAGSYDNRFGQHRGKGPRGYQRADDRIRDDINDRLADDSYLDATEIEVVVLNGEVTLSGTVDSRIDKRRAEDLCESVSGVRNVENRIRVREIFGDHSRSRSVSHTDVLDASRNRNSGSETSRNFN